VDYSEEEPLDLVGDVEMALGPTNANLGQQPGMDRAMHDFFQGGGDTWAPRTGQPQDFDPAAPAGGMSGMSLMPFPPISARVRPTRAFLIDDFLPRSLTDSYSQLTAQGAYQFAVDPTSGTFSLVPDVRTGQPKSSKVRCPNLAVFLEANQTIDTQLIAMGATDQVEYDLHTANMLQLAKRWAFEDVLNLDREIRCRQWETNSAFGQIDQILLATYASIAATRGVQSISAPGAQSFRGGGHDPAPRAPRSSANAPRTPFVWSPDSKWPRNYCFKWQVNKPCRDSPCAWPDTHVCKWCGDTTRSAEHGNGCNHNPKKK
jgi:hypothetical protein